MRTGEGVLSVELAGRRGECMRRMGVPSGRPCRLHARGSELVGTRQTEASNGTESGKKGRRARRPLCIVDSLENGTSQGLAHPFGGERGGGGAGGLLYIECRPSRFHQFLVLEAVL